MNDKKKMEQKPVEQKSVRPKYREIAHCGMKTEVREGEKTFFCNGCHTWVSVEHADKVS